MSSDPRTVARNRLAYSVNMWRDYESEQGAAVETVPGFRRVVRSYNGETDVGMQGMWHFKGKEDDYIIMHKGIYLDAYKIKDLLKSSTQSPSFESIYEYMNQFDSTTFTTNNRMYIVNGTSGITAAQLIEVYEESGEIKARKVVEYYVPTTYYNGKPYEQRNAFQNRVKQVDTGGGTESEYQYEYQPSDGAHLTSETVSVISYPLYDNAESIESVLVNGEPFTRKSTNGKFEETNYIVTYRQDGDTMKPIKIYILKDAVAREEGFLKVEVTYNADPNHFNVIGNLTHFQKDKVTMAEAILGCTKSAVYDGRVFLTGNPELPNTVFYSQRNSTGANDPTYFGVYNYFNDGDGNTPNVDLLATPSMLMVIKGDTTQDGSVYYHTAQYNTDEDSKDLVPRIYPSTQGAAGLGSAAKSYSQTLACNFLDDVVFISKRGLEGVSKEQLNAERTLGHRSSNVDRLLINEDLANASIAEWKGYLVICCNAHVYLADSRAVSQHRDGSYQYEWFYLEGVGTYEKYTSKFRYLDYWPDIEVVDEIDAAGNPTKYKKVSLGDFVSSNNRKISEWCNPYHYTTAVTSETVISVDVTYDSIIPKTVTLTYVEEYGENDQFAIPTCYLVEAIDNTVGSGDFYGAKRVLAVGDLLFFATDYDICLFNTDKRGEDGRIPSEWYNFNGVAYKSACATRLDDCDKKSLTKNTIYGTTAARFKMIPGSRCKVKASINGRDWEDVGEANPSRMDFADIRFDDFAFAEDEDDLTVLPELSRGWVHKQYYFYSDGYCEPFGLYELSYIYKIAGKIRYI